MTTSSGSITLPDAVAVARQSGLHAGTILASEEEVMGINDRVQLAEAEAVMQKRLREQAMRNGATLVAPETVFFSADTEIGRDVTIEPHVVFGPGVVVEDGAVIRSFSHLEGAHVGKGASVGPFARLRPGANLQEGANVGNFVEIKAAGSAAAPRRTTWPISAMHRSAPPATLAPARSRAITMAFTSTAPNRRDAFIGSNTSLVAPVKVGAGAMSAPAASSPRMSPA